MIQSTHSTSDPRLAAIDTTAHSPGAKALAVGRDHLSTAHSQALSAALARTPEARPEVVARGKALAADPSYPSAEIIGRVSALIVRSADLTEID
ncbi:MAG: hypothetical protein HY302_08960 [Opitutae bacterium]|nr:hypothetical protein [Opitutae bacterium]